MRVAPSIKKILTLSLVFSLGFLLSFTATAGCVVTKRTCVDPGTTKVINGIPVTRDCWGYEEEKTCLTVDEGVDGCSTLAKDVEEKGAGGCERFSTTCTDSVTDVDGNETCLKSQSVYRCEKEIELPTLNAEFKGLTTYTVSTQDTSACAALEANDSCTFKDEVTEDGVLVRRYACSDETITACSDLSAAKCARVKAPACDEATDPDCNLQLGRMRCTNDAYLPYVERGEAVILTQTKRAQTTGVEDESVREALENETTTCELVSSTCTDSKAGWRTVNGSRIYATCWSYKEIYRCRDTRETSTCKALEENEKCSLISTTCDETADDGTCAKETRHFECQASSDDVFEEKAEFEGETKTETDTVEVSNCSELIADGSCRKEKETCLKEADGKCVKTEVAFACGTTSGEATTINDCTEFEANSKCTLASEECLGTDASGVCSMKTRRYVCEKGASEITLGEVCDETLCIGEACEEIKNDTNAENFLQSAAILEIAREAGVYGSAANEEVFKGLASSCSVKAAGFSCCRKSNAASAADLGNRAFQIALTAGVSAGFEAVKYVGSPYVYDILSSHESLDGVLTAIYGENATGVYKPNFNFYGVSVSADATGSLTFNFSPSAFFLAIAMNYLTDYFSCEASDQLHVMREAAGLCHYVGSYCAKKSGVGCLVKKESWVCFNSKLARLVQEAARAQLGLGWGSPESPMIRGLTLEEFRSLDFTKMDLTGIVSEVALRASEKLTVSSTATTERAKSRVNTVKQSEKTQYETVDTVTGRCRAVDGTLVDCVTTK